MDPIVLDPARSACSWLNRAMSKDMPSPNRPFRWRLVEPDQLGALLDGIGEPSLWFADELVECAAKVLARCGDGELFFVGRSADSVFDLLSGALNETSWRDRLHQLPLSLFGVDGQHLSVTEVRQLRANLADCGITADALARRKHPVVFVDLVYRGSTFENLFHVLSEWVEQDNAQWDVIRLKLRFLGITWRAKTSPNTWRWHQHADWVNELPKRAIRNVSLDGAVWSYFGDSQPKMTPSFRRTLWSSEGVNAPRHSDTVRTALAEAAAIVDHGLSASTRSEIIRHLVKEPAISEPWLRNLVTELRHIPG